MKIAYISLRYDVVYDHAREFPQFNGSLWILIDKLYGDKEVDLFLVTERNFIDERYPDITREEIIATVNSGDGETMSFAHRFFRKIHELGRIYKINTLRRAWAISFYMRDPFNERRYTEVGHTIVREACDAYEVYCTTVCYSNFNKLINALNDTIYDWYVDIVPHRRFKA